MKLETATELLTTMKEVCKGLFPPAEQEALSLGIEALKRVQAIWDNPHAQYRSRLPGETAETDSP